MDGRKNLKTAMREDQKAGSYMSSRKLQECCHPFTHTHAAREQGLDQTFSRGPFQPKLLHDSVNTRVTKHQQVFQTLQSSKYSWSQQLGIPVTDMEKYSQSRREKENWPCQRSHILASMNKSNYHGNRE